MFAETPGADAAVGLVQAEQIKPAHWGTMES